MKKPFELLPLFQERVWGRRSLEPFFSEESRLTASDTRSIGEAWFSFRANSTSLGKTLGEILAAHPELLGTGGDQDYLGVCPILIKLLFTTERLSVQVHPEDGYAREHHQSLGKTEAWYVLDVQPPGELAVGFKETLTRERFRNSIESGEIEDLLDWRKVKRGETIFVPAGTVHAIGAGLTICEIQENSDITYRLYDYGRPRELHVEHGAAVSELGPHRHEAETVQLAEGRDELAACEYFRIERLTPKTGAVFSGSLPYYGVLICTKGAGLLDGIPARAGQAWFVPADSDAILLDAPGSEWIFTYRAASPTTGLQVN